MNVLSQEFVAFPELLCAYRERLNLSRNALAIRVGVDPSYLTRIEHGTRDPRRHIVDSLAEVLRLAPAEKNRFITAAGFTAPALEQIGEWDACIEEVCAVLSDPAISQDSKDSFRNEVLILADQWQRRHT